MAPGFALLLLVVALAVLAPVILLAIVVCSFRVALRQFALRALIAALVAGVVAVSGFAGLGAIAGKLQAESSEVFLVLFGAGFTVGALAVGGVATWRRFRERSPSHA